MDDFSVVGQMSVMDDGATAKIEGMDAALNGLTGAAGKVGGAFSSMGKPLSFIGNALSFVAGQAIFAGLSAVAAAAGQFASSIFQVGEASQAADVQLNAVLKSTKDVSGETAQSIRDLARSFSMTTMYSKETVMASQDILLTFTHIGKDVFPQATQAVLDMSTAMHKDLNATALQVGKALQDPIKGVTALRREGVMLTAQQQDQVKAMVAAGNVAGAQAIILKELQTEFGGSAQAAGGTFAGSLAILNNHLDLLREEIFTAILPALKDLVSWLTTNVVPAVIGFVEGIKTALIGMDGKLQPVKAGVETFWKQIMDIFNRAAPGLSMQVKGMLDDIKKFWDQHGKEVIAVVDYIFRFVVTFVTEAINLLVTVIRVGLDIIMGIWKVVSDIIKGDWKQAWLDVQATAQQVLNAILIFLATFFNTALSLTGTNLGDFLTMWHNNFENLKTIINHYLNDFLTTWKFILDNIGKVISKSLGDWIASVRKTLPEWLKQGADMGANLINGLLSGLEKAWKDVAAWLAARAKEAAAIWNQITGSRSPSTVFAQIGKNLMDGLVVGLQQNSPGVDRAMTGIANGLNSKAGGLMNSTTHNNNAKSVNLYFNGSPAQKPGWLDDSEIGSLNRLVASV